MILQNLQQSFSLAISSLESDLEDRVSTVMRQVPSFKASPDESYFNQIQQVKTRSSLVEEVFVMTRGFHITYPRAFHSGSFPESVSHVSENPYLLEGAVYEAEGKPGRLF